MSSSRLVLLLFCAYLWAYLEYCCSRGIFFLDTSCFATQGEDLIRKNELEQIFKFISKNLSSKFLQKLF